MLITSVSPTKKHESETNDDNSQNEYHQPGQRSQQAPFCQADPAGTLLQLMSLLP